ncbi:hypothetical protein [Pseudogemmobacter sonorensis]|uniref:hypothetical protein n=1 Tax=Pseudogemmobacter sonorensis TaxID=2989681 RepID=UPI0036C1CC8F
MSKIERRHLLTAAPVAGFAALAAGALPVEAEVADPHGGWLTEWRKARKGYADNLTPDGDETEASSIHWERKSKLESLICETPAATLAGITAKLAWILEDAEGTFSFAQHETAITTALDDLASFEA